MLERQVLVPVEAERLWAALTDPDLASGWFGASVRWDLHPGGSAVFTEDAGTIRHGVVDEVRANSLLRFRWWQEGDQAAGTSEVRYELEPADGGTRLRITEAPLPTGEGSTAGTSPGSAQGSSARPEAATASAWTAWDSRLVGVWACMSPASALVA